MNITFCWRCAISDLIAAPTFEVRDLLWRIAVTVLLLLILAGPAAEMLKRSSRSSGSSAAPMVQGF